MTKIGIALSGGGARGFAHLGVLKALSELGIKPSIISGTSAGAIVGAFYSIGKSTEEIISIFKNENFFGWSNLLLRKSGIFNMKSFEEIYLKHFPENSFEKLPIPLYIAATDIVKGEIKYFSSGNLTKALMASSCIPVVFEPIQHNDSLFLDGGILDNFPVEPLLGKCDKLIGVSVNSMSTKKEDLHMKDMLDRSFHLALSSRTAEKRKLCDLFIEPPEMSRFGIFNLHDADEIFAFAYEYTLGLKNEIKQLVA